MRRQPCKLIAYLAVIIGAGLMLQSFNITFAQSLPSNMAPRLHVEGRYLKDPCGNTVILRGLSHINPASFGSSRPNFKFVTDKITAPNLYTRVIRLPIDPNGWNSNPDHYFNNYVKPLVDYITEKGLYVIIDWHYVANFEDNISKTNAFWDYMAPKFKDYTNVIYEPYNETRRTYNWSDWKHLVQPLINRIRAMAPNTIIIVPSPQYDQHLKEAATSPFDDPGPGSNLMYASHNYKGSWYRGNWDQEVGVVAKVHPVFVTEFGYDVDSYEGGTQSTVGDFLKSKYEQYEVSWVAWVADMHWIPRMYDPKFGNEYVLLCGEGFMGCFIRDWLYDKRDSNWPPKNCNVSPTPTPIPTPMKMPIRIDAGASAGFTDPTGNVWSEDMGFKDGQTTDRGDIQISNTNNRKIYQTERYGVSKYAFNVANGTYKVNLHFAETYEGITAAGQRVFDVIVEGTTLAGIDVYAETGGRNTALIKTATVNVADGEMNLDFKVRVQNPMINAIEVLGNAATPTPTPSINFTIPVKKNWNLISLPVQPEDTDIADVLSGISGLYAVVHAWNGTAYESYYPGSSSSALNKMIAGRGYWIFMKEAANLAIKGNRAQLTVDLKQNWNLIGFNSITPIKLTQALASVEGKVIAVYAYNAEKNKYETVEHLEPGRGYWMFATSDGIWTIPSQ
jgi:endoglucanase